MQAGQRAGRPPFWAGEWPLSRPQFGGADPERREAKEGAPRSRCCWVRLAGPPPEQPCLMSPLLTPHGPPDPHGVRAGPSPVRSEGAVRLLGTAGSQQVSLGPGGSSARWHPGVPHSHPQGKGAWKVPQVTVHDHAPTPPVRLAQLREERGRPPAGPACRRGGAPGGGDRCPRAHRTRAGRPRELRRGPCLAGRAVEGRGAGGEARGEPGTARWPQQRALTSFGKQRERRAVTRRLRKMLPHRPGLG